VDTAKPSLLTGTLTDGHGNRFTPSHAVGSGRRYRYYVSAAPIVETGAVTGSFGVWPLKRSKVHDQDAGRSPDQSGKVARGSREALGTAQAG
jgi:hypothetical protein